MNDPTVDVLTTEQRDRVRSILVGAGLAGDGLEGELMDLVMGSIRAAPHEGKPAAKVALERAMTVWLRSAAGRELVQARIKRLIFDRTVREDAEQVVCTHIMMKAEMFCADGRPFNSWAYTLISNQLRNFGRADGRRKHREQIVENFLVHLTILGGNRAAGFQDPALIAVAHDLYTRLHKENPALVEGLMTGFSIPELSDAIGRSETTLKEARQSLRNSLSWWRRPIEDLGESE